jgi:peptidyl-prolyl cis-trans isomerase A (cyclophilin A)
MAAAATPEKVYASFETNKGTIVLELFEAKAPKTVANFIDLATGTKQWTDPRNGEKSNRPLYNGTLFHRVIPDFMIQGGDPLGTGTGGPGYKFADEIHPQLRHDAGVLSMANSGPNTNGCQFFITVKATPWLNGKHAVFGKVVKGMEVVTAISLVARDAGDRPREDVVLKSVAITRGAQP